MIELYTRGTPNGRKISLMLEEFGLEYDLHRIDIGKREQFDAISRPAVSRGMAVPA